MSEKENADSELRQAADLRREAEQRLHNKNATPVEGMAEVDVRALLHELQVHQIELEMQNEELLSAQAALQEVSDKYQDLFDFAPVGYFLLDEQGQILEINLAGAALLGLDRNTAVKQRLGQFVAMEHRAAFAEFCKRVSATDAKQTCEFKLQRNGESACVAVEGVPVQDGGGDGRLRVTVTDITARRQAEEATKDRDEELIAIYENAPIIMLLVDAERCVRKANRFAKQFAGASDDELIGRRGGEALRCVHATDDPRGCGFGQRCQHCPVRLTVVETFETGRSHNQLEASLPLAIEGRAQNLTFLLSTARFDVRGEPRVLVAIQDITDRKRAEEASRRLASIVESSSDAIISKTLDGIILSWNDGAERIYGYTAEEIVGKSISILVPSDRPDELPQVLKRVRQGERMAHYETVRVRKDGEQILVSLTVSPVVDAQGRIVGASTIARDITDRKRGEALMRTRLRLSELAQRVSADELIQVALDEAETLTDSCIGYFHLVDEDQENLTLQAWSTNTLRNMCRAEGKGLHYAISRAGVWVDCFHARTPVIHNDYPSLAHKKGRPEGHAPVVRDLGVPVLRSGRVVAIMGVGNKSTDYTQDDVGVLQSLVVPLMDLLAYKRAEEAMREAKAAAEAANVAKSQFLANMSHELRTPMNGVLGMTELALRAQLAPTVRDYLQTAHESAGTLLALLNDILDFSRIEAGRFELERASFCLRSTLDQTVKNLAIRAFEKGVELVCDVPSRVPDRLVGDALRLRQVLTNLVGNATKFTHQGEIVVRVGVQSQTAEDAVLEFSVADTGIGISPEEQERIFTPFAQADASTTRRYGGTGLGLSITKSIVAMMDGQLHVESQPGQGSTFSFTARLVLEPDAEYAPDAGLAPLERLRGLRVLVVDDNATNRRILEQTLLSWDMEPALTESAPGALAKLHEAASAGAPFPLLIVDAKLPGIDGFTLVQWIKDNPKLTAAAVLMLSPVDRQVVHQRAAQLDIAAYLEKPVAQGDLLRAITKALGVAARDGAAEERVPLEKAARRLRILLAEDNPANQKVALYILGERGHSVEIAQNGGQAIEEIAQQRFDVVLMDVEMPEMDGFQATAAIRALPDVRKAKLPIVAMTAHALKGDQERCLAAGMDDYISKPINAHELTSIVERLAGKGERKSTTESQDQSPKTQDPSPKTQDLPFDLDVAVSKCFGKYTMFQEMVECFFGEAAPLLGQMRTALDNGNATEMGSAAHRLKGTVAYLGAPPAMDAAGRVEQVGRSGNLAGAAETIDQLEQQVDDLKGILVQYRTVNP